MNNIHYCTLKAQSRLKFKGTVTILTCRDIHLVKEFHYQTVSQPCINVHNILASKRSIWPPGNLLRWPSGPTTKKSAGQAVSKQCHRLARKTLTVIQTHVSCDSAHMRLKHYRGQNVKPTLCCLEPMCKFSPCFENAEEN